MTVYGFMAKYGETGGDTIFSYVCDLLSVRLAYYGTAIETVWMTAYLRSSVDDASAGHRDLYEAFHNYLHRLPTIKFHRKLKRVNIEFVSNRFTSEDDWCGPFQSADKCNTAMSDVLEALQLLKKRIKATDDFDVDRFLADAARLLTKRIESKEEWLQISKEARAIETAVNAAKGKWDLLEIDWDLYHPRARTILDDPFYWDAADDCAPHGNDTGADLLEDFCRWEKRHKGQPALKFLDAELKGWDVSPIDWSVEDETAVRALEKEKWPELTLCNEAAIALAFALLKIRGECPAEVVRMALAAIKRTAILVKCNSASDTPKGEWEVALTKMTKKLESLPTAD